MRNPTLHQINMLHKKTDMLIAIIIGIGTGLSLSMGVLMTMILRIQ